MPSTGDASTVEAINESRLDNGIRVLSEHIPGLRSVSAGVWVRQGAAHETLETVGVSHLLEHMVFKGTQKRSAREIADALEALGGSLDAYTSREHTSYQARVLDEHVPEALDVLADLTLHPRLEQSDLELEREVIFEEIAQVEDTPDDLVFELHGDRLWCGHPYGRSILGTKETVSTMGAELLRDLHGSRYVGDNLVVAAAGNVEHESFVAEADRLFGNAPSGPRVPPVAAPENIETGAVRVGRASAQTHIVFGTRAPAHGSELRYPLVLLSAALGGGMSSTLFQRVREELGLCYSIFTYQSFYNVAGLMGVYVGTRPANADAASEAVREELARVAADGLGADGLERIKRQVKGQVMLSLESTGARLHRLASFALHEEPFLGLDGLLAKIDAVSEADVRRAAALYLDPARHLELRLGPDGEIREN
ncbi:MAG: insulinase family protein [Gemmatimonadota bacterium]|nr:insulinase family protein [Gemmatimonadota bacterium]